MITNHIYIYSHPRLTDKFTHELIKIANHKKCNTSRQIDILTKVNKIKTWCNEKNENNILKVLNSVCSLHNDILETDWWKSNLFTHIYLFKITELLNTDVNEYIIYAMQYTKNKDINIDFYYNMVDRFLTFWHCTMKIEGQKYDEANHYIAIVKTLYETINYYT